MYLVIIYKKRCTIKKNSFEIHFKICVSFLNIRLLGFHVGKTKFWWATGKPFCCKKYLAQCFLVDIYINWETSVIVGDLLHFHSILLSIWILILPHSLALPEKNTVYWVQEENIRLSTYVEFKNIFYNSYFWGVFYNRLDQ